MADKLPKLDRARLRERLLVEFERVAEEVSDAIDDAPTGRVIRDSEEKARDSLDRFRQIVYEEGLQAKINAAEAAFPPLRLARRPENPNATKDGSRTVCFLLTVGCVCVGCVGIAKRKVARHQSTGFWTRPSRLSVKACERWPAV